jgi:hypothetical protein
MTLAVISKEAFHQIRPGGRGGNEVEVKPGMTLGPSGGPGVLVGRLVIADEVKLELRGRLSVDLAQEAEPLLMAMARGGVGKDLAGKVVQGGKESHRHVDIRRHLPRSMSSLGAQKSW